MALLTGLGALTGALSNTAANKTSTTSNSFANGSTNSTNRVLTPYQTALQGPLFSYISQLMTNPTATLQPFKQQARDQVNQNYNGLSDSLRQQFLSTGGGSSGKFGTALAQGDLQRTGDLSNVDNTFAAQASALPLQAESLGTNLLGMNFGTTSTSTNSGTSNGTQVGAGSPLAGAFQGGTAGLGQQLMAAMLLGGFGG